MASDALVLVLVGAFLALLVFLVFREFWTWYWKQSEQVALLKQIASSLERLETRGGSFSPDHAAAVRLGLAPVTPGPAAGAAPPARGRTWLERLLNEDPQPAARG